METGKFDLDKSIADYVQLIQGKGSLTGSDAAELSAHLYDATWALVNGQLSQEEAFLIACKRLGNSDLLHQEYSKVNTSINVNKIWAYMFVGFSVVYAIPSFTLLTISLIDVGLIAKFLPPRVGSVVMTALHIGVCLGVVYLVRQKNRIAAFIEKQVNKNVLATAAWAFVPPVIFVPLKMIVLRKRMTDVLDFPLSDFGSPTAEMSFDIMLLAVVFGAISLLVSTRNTEKLSLKSLFTKPSYIFLILVGVVTELLAAMTRMIRFEKVLTDGYGIVAGSIVFGLVYMALSFIIAFYNKFNNNRYLFVFALFGFAVETGFGMAADINRGHTYYTAYFVSALIIGIVEGWFLGRYVSKTAHKAYN